jgi:Glycosyl hydrolase catalytic core
MKINSMNGLLLAFIFLLACQKNDSTGSGGSVNPPSTPIIPQGNYSGQKLVISQVQKTASPWAELNPDSVYTRFRSVSKLFTNLPTGFDNKIQSVYVPKGYMAVLASNDDGTGETITLAAVETAIRANLPPRLQNNISFVRCIALNNPGKKGTGSTNDTVVQALGDPWYYGWSLIKQTFPGQQFVPMTWGKGSCTEQNIDYLLGRKDIDHLLSFNEPDNSNQSNIPIIDTAIQRYRIMQKTGLRLGSPVVEQDNAFGAGKWLTNFMARAQAEQLRIDFINVHWYDWGNQFNNAATDSLTAERVFNRFVSYMEKVRQNYPGYPIWVTEYNANINRSSQTIHRYFMKLSTDWMNQTPYVERYAYFFPNSVPATNTDRSLNTVGNYWKNLSSGPKSISGNLTGDASLF